MFLLQHVMVGMIQKMLVSNDSKQLQKNWLSGYWTLSADRQAFPISALSVACVTHVNA